MNIEDIKVGETYNVRVKVECIDEDGWLKVRTSEKAISFILAPKELEAFSALPKYDPCRKFRAGDIVEPCQVKRRWWSSAWQDQRGIRFTVTEDENKDGLMAVKGPNSIHPLPAEAVFFQLVTPVEELEPYSVHESEVVNAFDIVREKMCVMTFPFGSKEAGYYRNRLAAKEAAEAERDRLNDEWRKEQK